MVKMIKDDARGVLAGVCCAAVVMMCDGVNGMDEVVDPATVEAGKQLLKNVDDKAPLKPVEQHFLGDLLLWEPIYTVFPFVIISRSSMSCSEWRELFARTKKCLSYIKDCGFFPDSSFLYYPIYCLCSVGSDSFISFCSSEQCDEEAVRLVAAFFSLSYKALSVLPSNDSIVQIISELDVFCRPVDLTQDDLKNIITRDLLSKIALQLEPLIIDENR
jgi:hypothetical protein